MTLVLLVLIPGLVILGVVLTARYLDALAWRRSLVAFTMRLPFGLSIDDIARWLTSVAAATHAPRLTLLPYPPVALEVVATRDGIQHLLLVPKQMQATILSG